MTATGGGSDSMLRAAIRYNGRQVTHDDGRPISPDDELTLYHETSADRAAHLRQHGTGQPKPVGARTMDSDYEPGRGMGNGLYLMHSPHAAGGVFGDTVLPVRVRAGDLAVPPERAHRIPHGMTPLRSLMVGDGYTEAELPHHAFGEPIRREAARSPKWFTGVPVKYPGKSVSELMRTAAKGSYRYEHLVVDRHPHYGEHHRIFAHDDDGYVGSLDWHPKSGTIDSIQVESDHQRRGVATQMLQMAREITPDLKHARPEMLSEDGAAWAKHTSADHHTGSRIEAAEEGRAWVEKVGTRLTPDKRVLVNASARRYSLSEVLTAVPGWNPHEMGLHGNPVFRLDPHYPLSRVRVTPKGGAEHGCPELERQASNRQGDRSVCPFHYRSVSDLMHTAAWEDRDGDAEKMRVKPVRAAGFKGYVGTDYYGGEEKSARDEPAHLDEHLHHFVRAHGADAEDWKSHAPQPQRIDLRAGVYATQSHVSQQHIDKYLADPGAQTHKRNPRSKYLGDEHAMFVTHNGNLHATDGHHRVAAALQRGDTHIMGWHHDLDAHPVGSQPVYSSNGMGAVGRKSCEECQGHAGQHTAGISRLMRGTDYDGETGNRNHITRTERGDLFIGAVKHLRGARGEVPGEHRNRTGSDWDAFKSDIAANGIQKPIFITVDHGGQPKLSEGNHRRDAAVELGLSHIPAEVRYYGHAEREGTVEERAGQHTAAARFTPDKRVFTHTDGLDHRLFDGERLRPEVRSDVLARFTRFCAIRGYRDWSKWGRLVFFGSEASEWSSATLEGNGDFDLSLGVDYPTFRRCNPTYSAMIDQEIAGMFTQQMHADLNDPQHYFTVAL